MLAQQPIPDDVDDRIARLAAAWRADADIAALCLFGSRADGRATSRSDVDLAVILQRSLGSDARWRKRLDLIGEACSRLGTDNGGPRGAGGRSVGARPSRPQEPQAAFETDAPRRIEAVEHVLRRYLDEAPLREAADLALGERVREGRFAR